MSSHDRRAAARRRAWGRGPIILRFEPLENRELLTVALPDLVPSSFTISSHNVDWGGSFQATGTVLNQGDAEVSAPFQVDIYASTSPKITATSVQIGAITIPAGLGINQSSPYNQTLTLPNTPLAGMTNANAVYIDVTVDPQNVVQESNTKNNQALGLGYDTQIINITAQQPALLQGAALDISSATTPVTWGAPLQITAQIRNNAQGDAPPTNARVVLTPAGRALGSGSDFTIGTISVPAIPAWQTANVQGTITLPALPPPALAGSSQFLVSLVQDADFVTNQLIPIPPQKGLGIDQQLIQIAPNPNTALTQGPLPDLAAGSVLVPTGSLNWGQSFQVFGTIENIGQANVNQPIRVRFALVGPNGNSGQALFLGDAIVAGLNEGQTQQIIQNLKLPSRIPNGLNITSPSEGRIEMAIDPNQTIAESFSNNQQSFSAPFVLRLPGAGSGSSVPTTPPVLTTPGVTVVTPSRAPALKSRRVKITRTGKIVRREVPPPHKSLTNSVEHNLSIFPKRVTDFFKKETKSL